jgi:hypothetical protein
MHPSFWLDDHLSACSNKDDESSIDEPQFNPEFDLDDNAEADLSEKENRTAILEQVEYSTVTMS